MKTIKRIIFTIIIILGIILIWSHLSTDKKMGADIIEQPITEKIILPLTVAEKAEIQTLVTKSEATLASKTKLSYTEALQYIKNLNDQTTIREFKNVKDLKETYPILKAELNNKIK